MFKIILVNFVLLISGGFLPELLAQKKVVIMGSSTAFGAAATSGSLGWVGRMQTHYNQNATDGQDTTFTVVGGYGYVTYFQMPSTYVPPPGRPSYVAGFNVDEALSSSPDIIIINLPTNDIAAGYTKKEKMDNLRFLRSFILANGVPGVQCYITTTQPRNDLTAERRDSLKTLVDSISNNFGIYSINFWDDLVTNDGQNLLRDDVRHLGFPDEAYHLNNLGHQYLFQKARDKNIFSPFSVLPVTLKNFEAHKKNSTVLLKWQTDQEEINTYYEIQRSKDGQSFESLYNKQAQMFGQVANYSWTDEHPKAGINYYRLKISEFPRIIYSKIIQVTFEDPDATIIKLYKNSNASAIVAEIKGKRNQLIQTYIRSVNGVTLYQSSKYINQPTETITIPISTLPAGQYFFTVLGEDGILQTKAFIK